MITMISEKVFQTLELDKILRRLAEHADFSASKERLLTLRPTEVFAEATQRLDETTQARHFLDENPRASIGGVRDVRPEAADASRGATLLPERLLKIQGTLEASAVLKRMLYKTRERFPLLYEHALSIMDGPEIISAIAEAIDDYAQVRDSASPELATIRRRLRSEYERLQAKLQSIIKSGAYASILQDSLVTLRGGRYVIPVRAESKGNVKGIIHDQSSSGATVYIEPLETVSINNEIRELEMQEADEIQRILEAITWKIAERADELNWTVNAIADLDAAFAKARFANSLDGEAPHLVNVSDPENPVPVIRLIKARHPLINPNEVVPIDVGMEGDITQLVITGPNTGGKTVTLKTVGLLILMAQSGLHIPAYGESVLTVFHSLYADIGDEQSIEQSLSTFSGHLTNVIEILNRADAKSLVLIDELGSGTDPAEGAAIARAILDDLLSRKITTLVATHYPELKAFAQTTEGVTNASMEFNVETLSPTYRLIIGLPGRSNALTIATRLGIPQRIIDQAREYVHASDLQVDDLIDEILRMRDEAQQITNELKERGKRFQQREDDLQALFDQYQQERADVIRKAEAEVQADIGELKEEVLELRRQIRSLSPTVQARLEEIVYEVEKAAEDAATLESLITSPRKEYEALSLPEDDEDKPEVLKAGEFVFVPSMNTTGQIISITGKEAEVQIGSLRTRIASDRLEWRSRRQMKAEGRLETTESYKTADTAFPETPSPGMEVNVISRTVEEALPVVDDYLDRAYRAGLPWCRIVHGKGTGALRKAVQGRLRGHPLVKDFRLAPENDGGSGVTIVTFVQSR